MVDGKFPLGQRVGGSDHSEVFLTERRDHPQKAVIKLVAADYADSERQLSRWQDAAKISHPHLIRIFDSGRCQLFGTSFLYVVMECAEEDLSQILPQRPLMPAEVADLLPPLLEAVAFLHANGYVHGRIKPTNVLAVGDQLKLAPDHIAPAADAGCGRKRRDAFDAPETELDQVSGAGDIWSIGATVVAALMQSAGFLEQGQTDPSLPSTMPEPFRGIATECLHVDPKRRSSITEVMARLQPVGRSVPAEPEPVLTAAGPDRHYHYGWRMLIPIAVLAAFVWGVRVFIRPSPTKGPSRGEQTEQTADPESAKTPNPPPAPPAHTVGATDGEVVKAATSTDGEVVKEVLPSIPRSAKNTIAGTVKIALRVEVDSSGKVTRERFITRGPSQYFASRAQQAAQRWEFTPPAVNGQPTASVWVVHFRLRRTSIQGSAEQARR